MATNQRVGIISKYLQDTSPLTKNIRALPSSGGVPTSFLSEFELPKIGSFFSAPSTVPAGRGQAPSFFSSIPSVPTIPSIIPNLPTLKSIYEIEQSSGAYVLHLLFYIFLYGLIVFLILLLINFTIKPMFQFVPGGPGFIPIPTAVDYSTYWADGVQPIRAAPDISKTMDELILYPFVKNYSLSVDIYLINITRRTGLDRLIFYSSSDAKFHESISTFKYDNTITLSENLASSSAPGISMICYIADDTNDIIITYFLKTSDGSIVQRSSFPIQNIPLYTAFRLSVVYDTNIFTVYYNGLQVSQTSVANTTARNPSTNQQFYANSLTTKCGYVQTLMLWKSALSYNQLVSLPVSLTAVSKFNLPANNKTVSTPAASCS